MWNLNGDTNEHTYETKPELQTQRTGLWLPRGEEVGEGWTGSLGLADANQYTYMYILVIYMNKQQGLTVQHRELYSYLVIAHQGK